MGELVNRGESAIVPEGFYKQVSSILNAARDKAYTAVNFAMVEAYWEIGKSIVDEQGGEGRAKYGDALIDELAVRLTKDFGRGFNARSLRYMLLASKDKEAVTQEIQKSAPARRPEDIIRDPYVLEFLGFSDDTAFRESDLEQALITHLQKFLLELGRGFAFEARQKRITFDGRHFYIDLVFYNYLMRCFVLIDLKTDDLTHQDLGQMQMYVNYYTRELMNEGDNPPIGIVLCADKSDSIVEYTLPEDNDQVFTAKYLPYLPSKEELARELSAEYRAINEATNGETQG